MMRRLLLWSLLASFAAAEGGDGDVIVAAGVEPPPNPNDEEVAAAAAGEFAPPDADSMLKFEAEDAVVAGGGGEEKDGGGGGALKARELFETASSLMRQRQRQEEAWELMRRASELGSSDARLRIAFAQLLGGRHFAQDVDAARATFERLADDEGHPDAQFGMGFLHATGVGLGCSASQSKALLYYTFAAFGGSEMAQMALGYRHWAGVGVAASCEKALDNYRRVADAVASRVSLGSGGAAVQRVRLLDEIDSPGGSGGGGGSSRGGSGEMLDNDLFEYYQLLADNGDVRAQVGLGTLYFKGGRGVDVDHGLALGYFKQAAEAGNPTAMAYLGKMHLEGSPGVVEASNATALYFFRAAAELGNPEGQSGLGLMHLEGRGVDPDPKKAAELFRKAADQHGVDGQLHLGNLYYRGLGVARDYHAAVKYFNLASRSGHVLAFHRLAEMHATGTGVVLRSCPTAAELYKNVAERGRWGELLMEAHGDYGVGRLEEASAKYLLLSELGYEVAQSNAGFLIDGGETGSLFDGCSGGGGGERTVATGWLRALVYWGRAAAQGYSAARVKLGDYHYYGLGMEPDFETAASHYRIAYEQQNNAQAMFNLGYMYELGQGMPRDLHLAKRFYDLAADTATDAKIPVAIALAKLGITFAASDWKVTISPETWANIELYWDIYLLSVLLGLLGLVLLVRRPQQHPTQPPQPPPPAPQQQQQQPQQEEEQQ